MSPTLFGLFVLAGRFFQVLRSSGEIFEGYTSSLRSAALTFMGSAVAPCTQQHTYSQPPAPSAPGVHRETTALSVCLAGTGASDPMKVAGSTAVLRSKTRCAADCQLTEAEPRAVVLRLRRPVSTLKQLQRDARSSLPSQLLDARRVWLAVIPMLHHRKLRPHQLCCDSEQGQPAPSRAYPLRGWVCAISLSVVPLSPGPHLSSRVARPICQSPNGSLRASSKTRRLSAVYRPT